MIAIAACICVVTFAVLDDGGREYDSSHEYQDYWQIDGDGILGTDGPVEIVTVDGTTYAHATGRGHAEIVRSNGSVDRYNIAPAKADLIIMDGQSNAAYNRADPTLANAPERGTSFYFGREDEAPYTGDETGEDCDIYDMVDGSGILRIGDKGPEFCRVWTEETGKKAIWVSLGIGARGIDSWQPPAGASWRQNLRLMDAFWDTLEGYPFEIDRTIVMWAQGEANIHMDKEVYKQKFENFQKETRSAWHLDDPEWYFIDGRSAQVGEVNEAFRMVEGIPVCVPYSMLDRFTVANGLLVNDLLHYTQRGDNAVANAAARFILGLDADAPIYLVETSMAAAVGSAATAPSTAKAYRTDQTASDVQVAWDSEPDTTAAGTFYIYGSTTGYDVLPNAPAPVLKVVVS